jgi:hypothetical protein
MSNINHTRLLWSHGRHQLWHDGGEFIAHDAVTGQDIARGNDIWWVLNWFRPWMPDTADRAELDDWLTNLVVEAGGT